MQNITETGLSTISNKIVETVLSNRVKKKSPPPPPKVTKMGSVIDHRLDYTGDSGTFDSEQSLIFLC